MCNKKDKFDLMTNRCISIGVIADDLTGAMDTGLQFSKHGLDTVVQIVYEQSTDAAVLVLDTDSRAANAEEVVSRVSRAARVLIGRYVYKKIDSTMRGNIGIELLSTMDVLDYEKAVVAPAFPLIGRTTINGHQLVNGIPLEKTSLADDPGWPMKVSYIPDIIAQQTNETIALLGLDIVEKGAGTLSRAVDAAEARIVAIDASRTEHLVTIAKVLVQNEPRWLPCGSAGLAEKWLSILLGTENHIGKKRCKKVSGPVIAAVASRNAATVRQIAFAQVELKLKIVSVRVRRLDEESWRQEEHERLLREISVYIANGQDVLLTSTMFSLVLGLEREVVNFISTLIKETLKRNDLAGLFLSGGDLAISACRMLGTSAISIEDEVQPGIPAGTLVDGDFPGLLVVTKAGGFGNERAIVDALNYMHGDQYK